jgi:hypothetical protein
MDIIKQDITGDYIFVVREEDKGKLIAEKRYITTGVSHKAKTLILKGIRPGERIIFNGYNLVRNGSLLNINKVY